MTLHCLCHELPHTLAICQGVNSSPSLVATSGLSAVIFSGSSGLQTESLNPPLPSFPLGTYCVCGGFSTFDLPSVRLDRLKKGQLPPPVIRFCKSAAHADILAPDIHFQVCCTMPLFLLACLWVRRLSCPMPVLSDA